MDEVKKFFTARGIGTSDLAKGLVVHEVNFTISCVNNIGGSITYNYMHLLQVLGVAILFSAWGGCYLMRPSTRFFFLINPSLQMDHMPQNLISGAG